MAGYADLTAVRAIVGLADDDTAATARLEALNAALTAIFESKVGRTWSDDAPTARTVAVPARFGAQPYGASPYPFAVLPLPQPGIRSLVSLKTGPTWDGSAWTGGTDVDLAGVVPIWPTLRGDYLGLQIGTTWPWTTGTWWGGCWTGTVLVEAIWADQLQTVPDEVVEALNFLVAEEFKQERASPESLIGPDGLSVRTRNPWNFERVKAVIDKYDTAVLSL